MADELLFEAGVGAAGHGGEVAEVVGDGVDLEADGAGVFFFAKEEVEDGVGLGVGEVAAAVGHSAVGDIEEGAEKGLAGGVYEEGAVEEIEDGVAAFDAAAEVEEAPAVAAGDIFHGHAGEGGEAADEAVEGEEGVVEVGGVLGEFLLEFGEDAPGVDGEVVADAPGGAAEVGEGSGEVYVRDVGLRVIRHCDSPTTVTVFAPPSAARHTRPR